MQVSVVAGLLDASSLEAFYANHTVENFNWWKKSVLVNVAAHIEVTVKWTGQATDLFNRWHSLAYTNPDVTAQVSVHHAHVMAVCVRACVCVQASKEEIERERKIERNRLIILTN